jgi:alanine racemase
MDGLYSILKDIRPTHAIIDLTAIDYNIRQIRNIVGPKQIMAIVKANAYGHGILEVSEQAIKSGVEYIGVGFLEEGIFLRQNDIDAPILVMGGILGYQVKKFIQYDLEMTVSSLELAKHINEEMKKHKARVHLKIDTGMERIGVSYQFAVEFIKRVAMLKNIEIVGLYSHFSTSDESDTGFMHLQLQRFHEVIDQVKMLGIEIPLRHISNSAAIVSNFDCLYELVRPGIMLYGILPTSLNNEKVSLKPALSLISKVVFTKRVKANTAISYNRKYYTEKDTNIITVPIGYGDGYSRLLSNCSEVLIHGKRYPTVGAVCMDQLMVDVDDDVINFGDEVILLGNMGDNKITAWEIAEKMGTIPYEVLCMINARVPRLYIRT